MQTLERNLAVFNQNKLLILQALYGCEDHLCGCDLVDKLGLAKNLLSYHIAMLEKLGYIEGVRCGRNKNYRIRGTQRDKVEKILDVTGLI